MEALAAIDQFIYVADDDAPALRVDLDTRTVTTLNSTFDQWFKFSGAYAIDPTPEQAKAALDLIAAQTAPAADEPPPDDLSNLADPDVLGMTGPGRWPTPKAPQ